MPKRNATCSTQVLNLRRWESRESLKPFKSDENQGIVWSICGIDAKMKINWFLVLLFNLPKSSAKMIERHLIVLHARCELTMLAKVIAYEPSSEPRMILHLHVHVQLNKRSDKIVISRVWSLSSAAHCSARARRKILRKNNEIFHVVYSAGEGTRCLGEQTLKCKMF